MQNCNLTAFTAENKLVRKKWLRILLTNLRTERETLAFFFPGLAMRSVILDCEPCEYVWVSMAMMEQSAAMRNSARFTNPG